MNRRDLLLVAPAVLCGCATSVSTPDGTQVKPGEGLLALHLSANGQGVINFNPYGVSSFGDRFAENMFGAKGSLFFKNDEKFLVTPVEAGQYMWSKLSIDRYYAWLLNSTHFQVRGSTITYIGHIRIFISGDRYSISVRDREADMRQHLQQKFPAYSQSLPFEKTLADVRLSPPQRTT